MSFIKKIPHVALCLLLSAPALAQSNSPVDLQADSLQHDDTGQKVTASGNVILKQDGKTVSADKIVYLLNEDKVIATGNVVFVDITGDKHAANRVEFSDALKDGFVEGLQTLLVDGSRFTASNGKYKGGVKTTLKDATYSPCELCETNPEKALLWQIRASEVEHNKEEKRVSYRNARFEIKGVPVAYLPYFSHPDGSVKRKSGVLTPSAGFSSDQGLYIENSYYWAIDQDKDLTAGLRAYTKETPLALMEYRQRWEDASLNVNTNFTVSDRTDNTDGVNFSDKGDLRGNIKAKARWDINNKWRSGLNVDYASDDQFLRQYDFDDENVLENELYVERFSGRNYASARLLAFQDVRVEEERSSFRDENQPIILPEIEASFIGEPNAVPVIGGRWDANVSLLSLIRDQGDQDMNRAHLDLGWHRKLVSDYGLVTKLDASAETTFYQVNDRVGSQTDPTIKGSSNEARTFGYVNAEASYPMVKQFAQAQAIIEPVASLTLSPDKSINDDIPNEDSVDAQLNTLNLFKPDRFPGIDGIEDQSHVTYGLRTGVHRYDGSHGEVFIGQSYRFEEDENPFAQRSGLDDRSSDVVGQITGSYKGDYTLDYRFQLDNDALSSVRHEVDASMKIENLNLSTRYLFADSLEGTDIEESREQIVNSASYRFNDQWSVHGSARHDLGEDPGLRKAYVGLDYSGQCISWALAAERNLTNESSGDNGTEIFLRIGFKNLGEFETSR